MRKTIKRALSCALALAIVVTSFVFVNPLEVSAASSGDRTGQVARSVTGKVTTLGDSTVFKIQPSYFTDASSESEMSSLDKRQDGVVWGGTTLLVQTNDNASFRKEFRCEAYKIETDGSCIYSDWSGRYIEDYKSKICSNADGEYFYNTIKGAVSGANPSGIDGSDSTPVGQRLNAAITKSNKAQFIKGYKWALQCVVPAQYSLAAADRFDAWVNSGAASIICTELQGLRNCAWNLNGSRSWLMSTRAFVEAAQALHLTTTNSKPSAYEGWYLDNKRVKYSPSDNLGDIMWQIYTFENLSAAMYPMRANGTPLRDFGGWGYYLLNGETVDVKGKTVIEKGNVFTLGDVTQGSKFGQDGIVAVQDLPIDTQDGHVVIIDLDVDIDKLFWSAGATAKCDTPNKDTTFSLVGYRYRIVSNSRTDSSGKLAVLHDWQYVYDTSKPWSPEMRLFDDTVSKIPSYRCQVQAIYRYNLASNYKAPSAAQNLLTVTYGSLKNFTKTNSVPNNQVDDRFNDVTVARDSSGKQVGFGYSLLQLSKVTPSFVTNFTAYGNGLAVGKTYQTQSSQTTLNGAQWNNWGTTQHDTSVWISRASVNDVVHLASWSNNGSGVTDFLVNTGKFLNSNKGRGTQPAMTSNGVAGFVRSNSAVQSIGTDNRAYDVWDEKGNPVTRTWNGIGEVDQGAIDTQVGANFARYTPKNLYPSVPKGVSKGIQEYSSNSSYSAAVVTGKTLYVNPEVTMQYQDLYGNTGNVVTAGDKMRSIPVIALNSFNLGADGMKVTLSGTAIATDVRAKALSNKFGNLPVFLPGGGIAATFTGGTLSWKTYVLDVANASLKSAWGDSGYNPADVHQSFISGMSTASDDAGSKGGVTGNGDHKATKSISVNVQGLLNIGASATNAKKTVNLASASKVSVNVSTGTKNNTSGLKTDTTSYPLTIRGGKITDYGGLPQDIANKMHLSEVISSAFESKGGTNGWYNEDSTALCVRCYTSYAEIPNFTVTDKLPLDIGPKSNTADKNAAWIGALSSIQAKVTGSMKLNYSVAQKHTRQNTDGTINTWYTYPSKSSSVTINTSTPITKDVEFVLPNKTVLDINQ